MNAPSSRVANNHTSANSGLGFFRLRLTSFFEQQRWRDTKRLRDMPERDNRDILLTALHSADMRPIDTHLHGEGRLTQIRFDAVVLEIIPKSVTDIHPPTKAYRVF